MYRKHLYIVDELVGKKVSGGCLKLKTQHELYENTTSIGSRRLEKFSS